MSWKRMKGLVKAVNKCPKCNAEYPDIEYDLVEDLCHFCLYPETQKSQSTEYSRRDGDPKNKTEDGKRLEDLPYLKEKQSPQAEESYIKRNIYKGNGSV